MPASDEVMGLSSRRSAVRAGKAFQRLIDRLSVGRLELITPDGERLYRSGPAPGPEAVLAIHAWRAVRRSLWRGFLGFAEAYIEGEWSSPDLAALLEFASLNQRGLVVRPRGVAGFAWLDRLKHRRRANTRAGSRRNIPAHYDLGNRFYAAWLDRGMSYSSGIWRDPDDDLDRAQAAKLDRVAGLLALAGGERVLEIGCGWGALAEHLTRNHGVDLTGITLSPAQRDHARARLDAAGLGDRARIVLQDYREATGLYDRIVSIEMLEAVGEAYWPAYFQTLKARLAPGGQIVLQVITIDEADFPAYRGGPDFIQRYVFPGGMLPTLAALDRQIEGARLRLVERERFGASYARTLKAWNERFQAQWPAIAAMGFDERFKRLWEYYLAYCEAGFRTGRIDVSLMRLAHERD